MPGRMRRAAALGATAKVASNRGQAKGAAAAEQAAAAAAAPPVPPAAPAAPAAPVAAEPIVADPAAAGPDEAASDEGDDAVARHAGWEVGVLTGLLGLPVATLRRVDPGRVDRVRAVLHALDEAASVEDHGS